MRTSVSFKNSGRRAIALSVVVGLMVMGLGWYFWVRGQMILREELRTRLQNTAGISALLINSEDVEAIRSPEHMDTPAFHRLVDTLKEIRSQSDHVRFAYIMRKTYDPMILEFVADADALGTLEELDTNGNGMVDADEEGSHPGELYDITEMPALQGPAFIEPTVDQEFTKDQWGILISGYAPIRDDVGRVVATLGLDMRAEQFVSLSSRIFSPVVLLLVVLLSIVVVALIQWDSVQRRMASAAFMSEERSGLLQLTLHRLGTPLTIFKWSLESLADCATGKNCPIEDVEDHIRQMQQGIGSMEGIVKQLLEVEKVEEGTLQNDPRPTPICPVIDATVQEVGNEIKGRKQTISIEECQEATASIDPEILRGVLRELLHNASTFSPEGSEIRISSMRRRSHIVIAVQDRGCGVPDSELHRMFQKFGRASNAHLSDPNGAGLGLYICRHVIELAGGKIDLESEEGNGTTVTFSVPAN